MHLAGGMTGGDREQGTCPHSQGATARGRASAALGWGTAARGLEATSRVGTLGGSAPSKLSTSQGREPSGKCCCASLTCSVEIEGT